jgi:N-acetylmuramoyl-L-alanine amidase
LPRTTPTQTALATAAVTAEAMPPPERNSTGGFSIARQLGLGVSRIVIDPGHGGHDPGATGNGVSEAELVLDVAQRLEKLLQKQPGIEVVLTRRTNDFVALPGGRRSRIVSAISSCHPRDAERPARREGRNLLPNLANNLSAASFTARGTRSGLWRCRVRSWRPSRSTTSGRS